MKRRKKLWIMGGILALVLVLTLSAALIDHKIEKIQQSGETILTIPVDTVTALSWDYQGETLSFTRDEQWHYAGDDQFPVSTDKLEEMLETFDGLSAAFRIDDVEDYSQYGLDNPVCTIALTAGDRDWEIRLGAFSKIDEQRYVDIGDGSVYLVFSDPMMAFDRDLRSVIENDHAPYLDTAARITFQGVENYSILREPEGGSSYREDDIYFAQQGGQLLPLDPVTVENYLSDMTLIELTDYMTYTADQEDLAQYGLDDPELTIEVVYDLRDRGELTGEQASYVLHIGRNQAAVAEAAAQEDPEPVPAYARVGDSRLVYEIDPEEYDRVAACAYNDLRHFEVFPADTGTITGMHIQLDGEAYDLQKDPEAEEENSFLYGEQTVDAGPVLSALHSLHTQEFTDAVPSGKLEIRMALTLGDQGTVTLELYRKDGQLCLARVDGKTVSLLPRSQAVDLIEKINAIVLDPAEPTQTEE